MLDFNEDDIHVDDFARGSLLRFIAKKDKVLAWEICQIYGKGRRVEKIDAYKDVYKRLQDRRIFLEAMAWSEPQAIAKKFCVTVTYVRALIKREVGRRLRGELGGRPTSPEPSPLSKPSFLASSKSQA